MDILEKFYDQNKGKISILGGIGVILSIIFSSSKDLSPILLTVGHLMFAVVILSFQLTFNFWMIIRNSIKEIETRNLIANILLPLLVLRIFTGAMVIYWKKFGNVILRDASSISFLFVVLSMIFLEWMVFKFFKNEKIRIFLGYIVSLSVYGAWLFFTFK